MMDKPRDLKERTKTFSLEIIRGLEKIPNTKANNVLSHQLLRSAASVGANYRAARVGRSKREFIAKLQIALEEADETQYWIELLNEINKEFDADFHLLLDEAKELTAILTSALKTARGILNT